MKDRTQLQKLFPAFAVILLIVGGIAAVAAPVAAQSTETTSVPYYPNSTGDVDNETWLAGVEEPTLENVTSIAMRFGSFVIGTGDVGDQGGEGAATGAVIFGLTAFGVLLGVLGGGRVGSVGGSVLSIATAAGLVQIGFAPPWMWAVVLFGVGILLSTVIIRTTR